MEYIESSMHTEGERKRVGKQNNNSSSSSFRERVNIILYNMAGQHVTQWVILLLFFLSLIHFNQTSLDTTH